MFSYNSKIKFARMLSSDANVNLVESRDSKVTLTIEGKDRYTISMPHLDAALADSDPRSIWWWGTYCNMLDRIHHTNIELETQAVTTFAPTTIFGQVMTRVLATNATYGRFGQYSGKDTWVLNSLDHDAVVYEADLTNNPPTEKNDTAMVNTVLFDQLCKSIKYGTTAANYTPSNPLMMKMGTDEGLVEAYNTPKTSLQPVIKVVKAILKHLDFDPEEEEEKAKEEAQANAQGKGKAGEGEEEEGEQYNNTISFKDVTENGDNEGRRSTESMDITYDEDDLYDRDTYIPIPLEILQPDYHTGSANPYGGDKLTRQIANVLKTRSQVRWEGGKRSGRLRNRSLARAGSNPLYDTPFRKKIDSSVLDTCVMLLVDTSGSMGGGRYDMAMESAVKLATCLSGVHIPVAVAGFTQTSSKNKILIHQDFNGTTNLDKLYSSMQAGSYRMGCNDDGISLNWAGEHLSKQKQSRKVLIVLSDGQPAASSIKGNCATYLKTVVGQLEKEMDVYAIGIQTDSVAHFYSNHKTLMDVRKLEPTILNIIKDQII